MSKYIKNADTESIADFVLEGAKLPDGMDKTKAKELILDELKNIFFDDKTKLEPVTTDNLLAITDGLMQKHGIIPSDTQGNLLKAKKSANNSLEEFMNAFACNVFSDAEENLKDSDSMAQGVMEYTKAGKKFLLSKGKYPLKQKIQEQLNLLRSPETKALTKNSKSTPKKNSEEFLTYYLKQGFNPENLKEQNIGICQ